MLNKQDHHYRNKRIYKSSDKRISRRLSNNKMKTNTNSNNNNSNNNSQNMINERRGFSRKTFDSSKKKNLNHLLNFSYERDRELSPIFKPKGVRKTYYNKYRKESFVQANYRFLLRSSADCIANFSNPDEPLNWKSVEMVYLPSTEIGQCPICLDVLTVPRITQCGHVYCFTCILHYLSLEDGKCRCPLCFDNILPKSLKSLHIQNQNELKEGDEVTMILLKRQKDCIIPEYVKNSNDNITVNTDLFALYKQVEDIEDILDKEEKELKIAMNNENDPIVLAYFQMALELLGERRRKWNAKKLEIQPKQNNASNNDMYDNNNSNNNSDSHDNQKTSVNTNNMYWFYQAIDGQNYFLDSLNYRCLLDQYEDADSLPSHITAKIIEITKYVQDDITRKRFRFLSHLPLTTSFVTCELDLSHIIKSDILKKYQDRFNMRQDKRQKKLEEKAKMELNEEMEKLELISQRVMNYTEHYKNKELLKTENYDESFPVLPESPVLSPTISPRASPQLETKSGWNNIAGKGFAASDMWQPLPSSVLSPNSSFSVSRNLASSAIENLDNEQTVVPSARTLDWNELLDRHEKGKQNKQTKRKNGKKGRGKKISLFSTHSRPNYHQ